jgi:23S rRNA (uracil1939-C5)-methyltransferase
MGIGTLGTVLPRVSRTMRPVKPVQLRPDRFAAGGEAIARDDGGRVVFVRGAIPGETVVADVTDEKRDWARAHVVDVLDPSPERVVPPCASRLAGCGGCGWMHLDHAAQHRAKVTIAEDALRRIGHLTDAKVELGPSVAAHGYRTTIRVAGDAEGRAGFRAERSHDVVAAPACLVAHPPLRRVVAGLHVDPGVEATLRTSVATGQLGARWDRAKGAVRGLPVDALRGGTSLLYEDVAGRRLRVSLGSFFQSGPEAAALLVGAVGRAAPELGEARMVVDAYAGVGMLGACVTRSDARVVAIETSRTAVADASENLADRPGEVVRAEVGAWQAPGDGEVDVVIADPSRTGLGAPGATALSRVGAPVLVLVSCDPASLGRDARLLTRSGYRHERSEVIDTFPETVHVEVVSRFTRA